MISSCGQKEGFPESHTQSQRWSSLRQISAASRQHRGVGVKVRVVYIVAKLPMGLTIARVEVN